MPNLVSVNIGVPEKIDAKAGLTGIFKRPQSGSVQIGAEAVIGDAVLDRRHHGGVDQAVYVYLNTDYDWWTQELNAPISPGTFGENLTISEIIGDNLAIGDRFIIGDVVLEITCHRTPCRTLAARMGDAGFIKRFLAAGRSGAYCRVMTTGAVTAGDKVEHKPFAGPRVTVAELMAHEGTRELDADYMARVLATPVHYKMRQDFEKRLAKAE
ncbi:MOSC domain-containing protein [Devosia rhodophyticola]|uniref:MOSC domain-containing protein n=1 Tax=Devosia rhodophyticola TaxID=3026423 RepID=A0ABY7YTH2_9HYPH|nr:MOSC domain-containing protein [Devosia rhodophyticola]WDR04604.1 MOSC domain-containing protein [Devosia rhodophyticola]